MINTPPILTEDGNIRIHNKEGARIPIFFELKDGTPRPMAGATLALMCPDGFRREFEPGDAINEMVLTIEPEDFADHVDKTVEFIVRDETTAEMPVIWKGIIIVEGW